MSLRSDAWFRRVGKASLTKGDGTQVTGFGAVMPWGEGQQDLWGERSHGLGRLPSPLYRFVGSFPEAPEARGAKLTQGENSYRVLRWEPLTLGGRRLGERALLERWEETHG